MDSLIARAPAIVIAGAAVLAAGACAGSATVPVWPAAAAMALNCRAIIPASASFVSGTTGWLLGLASPGASRIVLCRTADGGHHWSPVPAPPAPLAYRSTGGSSPAISTEPDAVSRAVFADQRDGWAFGPGLWATHDGGVHWHRIGTSGAIVAKLTATPGRVVAVFSRQGGTMFTAYTSPAEADGWRPVPGGSGAGGAAAPDLAVSGRTGYLASDHAPLPGSPAMLLTGPADGSARWQRYPLPCAGSMVVAVTAATGPGSGVACAGVGFHPTPTRVYRSVSRGRTWQRLADLVLEDSVGSVSAAPDGTILVSGQYSGVLVSSDRGQSWHPVSAVDDSEAVQGGGIVTAVMVTDQLGFAVVTSAAFWLTHDGGRTWTQVTVDHH
jgi:photosystem II stability/assembly factor-like uncharacterized protein